MSRQDLVNHSHVHRMERGWITGFASLFVCIHNMFVDLSRKTSTTKALCACTACWSTYRAWRSTYLGTGSVRVLHMGQPVCPRFCSTPGMLLKTELNHRLKLRESMGETNGVSKGGACRDSLDIHNGRFNISLSPTN